MHDDNKRAHRWAQQKDHLPKCVTCGNYDPKTAPLWCPGPKQQLI